MAGTRTEPFVKDPDDLNKTFAVNWVPRLSTGDTLSTSVWAVISGTVIIATNTSNTTHALVSLSGGTLNEKAVLRNRVTTALGEQLDQTIYVLIMAR